MPRRANPVVENIGVEGARRRRVAGLVCLAISIVVAIALVATHASRPTRLMLAIPVGLAAAGLLEAREKTCVVHGALGTQEADERGVAMAVALEECRAARRQSISIVVRSALIAALVAAIAWVV